MLSSLNGIHSAFNKFNTTAYNIAKSSIDLQNNANQDSGSPAIQNQNSNVNTIENTANNQNNDLTYNLVDIKTSEIAVAANVKVLKTEKNMIGSLLNINA